MTTTYDIPHPGDRLNDGRTVIASVWGNDFPEDGTVWWLLLILNPEAPFFSVEQQEWNGNLIPVARESNIVEAVRCYEQNGGDI